MMAGKNAGSKRRRGQALLLAVLLMVFAAALGFAFITVVSLNLSQTARREHKEQARVAAQAALAFADSQLVGSADGDRWRPESETPPPAPGDLGYNEYYNAFDRAQGWTRTVARADSNDEQRGEWDNIAPAATSADDRAKLQFYKVNRDARIWVKFPDPRQAISDSAVVFFLESHLVKTGDKRGMTQITAIGLSPENPAVFERRIAFKDGALQNPLTAVARSVSNWDFERHAVPSARIASSAGTSLVLKDVRVPFPTTIGAFYAMLGDPITAIGVRGVAVASATAFNSATQTQTLTLTSVPVPAPSAGERVELAAGLGAPTRIDYDFDGALTPNVEEARFKPSDGAAPGGVWVNGGLLWFGNVQMGLRSPGAAGNEAAGAVRVSGLISEDNSDATNQPAAIGADISYQGSSGGADTLSGQQLLSSDNPQFPFDAADVPTEEKSRLVSDGWSRLSGDPGASGRQVQSFASPDAFGAEGVARYRGLSRFSPPAPGAPDNAGLFGGGEGIYIDNRDDRERVGTGAGVFRDMTQPELVSMWLSSHSTPASPAERNGVPSAATDAGKSLEEQHLRGWIGPDEFRARGALIELLPDNPDTGTPSDAAIAVTLDARTDGPSPDPAFPSDPPNNRGPVRRKTWKSPATGARQPGVYTRVFAWPQNGVIFGEGNLRVRGEANTARRSLTVVSMRNIYIEGSLAAGNRKVLLLARQNVVLNPTGVFARIEAQTLLTGPPDGNDLPVADAAAFLPNDWISVDGATAPRRVTAIGANRLTLNEAPPPGVLNGASVRTISDPLEGGKPRTDFGRLAAFDDVLQRRFRLPAGPSAPLRFALRHSAERVTAWTLGADEGNPPFNPNPLLGIKVVPPAGDSGPPTTIARPADKILDVTYTDAAGTAGRDVYPLPPGPMSQSEATAITIADLRAAMLDTTTGRPAPTGPPPYSWYYTSPSLAPDMSDLPFLFLAGIGNRYDGFAGAASGGQLRRNLITGDYDIPLATSVEVVLDGARSVLRGDRWNTSLSNFERVGQFGFSPTHGAELGPDDPAAWEDVLTADQSFYTSGRHTLDSRVLSATGAGAHSLALRFGGDAIKNYFAGSASLPAYRAARLKLENVGLNAAPDFQFETLAPGATLNVRAFVYAQQGSWIVIPGVFFDDSVKSVPGVRGSYVETDAPPNGPTAGEFLDTAPAGFSDGDYADLDHDGVISRAEQVAPLRYGRYNYQINFLGTIMEHHTALVRDPDGAGPLSGAVADWMDKWSTVEIDAANWNGAGAGDTFRDDLSAANDDFGGISYRFDDAAARGFFDLNGNGIADAGESVEEDSGFRPPVSPGLMDS